MTIAALLFMYESWRTPRRLQDSDRLRNVLVKVDGVPVAAMQWRAPR